jgi:hypothetical protein
VSLEESRDAGVSRGEERKAKADKSAVDSRSRTKYFRTVL